MKLSKHKKGSLWSIIIGIIICIVIAGVLFGIAGKWKVLSNAALNLTHFGLAGGDAPNVFLFEPKSLNIVLENNNCVPNPVNADDKDRRFKCKPGIISFETSIYNGGPVGSDNSQRRFYGGIVVCKITCKTFSGCSLVDKTCGDTVYQSITGTCTVKSGDTKICDAGSHKFDEGEYLVYPAAVCFLDEVYGCYQVGMTEAPKRTNTAAYLRLTVSK